MKRRARWWHAAISLVGIAGIAGASDLWRDYDAPFYRDSWTLFPNLGWKGSDGIVSIPLPAVGSNNRSLMMFGDSWIYETWGSGWKINQIAGGPDFTQLSTPRNSLALLTVPSSQPWVPPGLTFYGTDSTNDGWTIKNLSTIGASATTPPLSFAYSYAPRFGYPNPDPAEENRWKWPTDGVHQGNSTNFNIFWHEFVTDPNCAIILGGLVGRNILYDELYIERIRNPSAAPDAWQFGSFSGGLPSAPTRFADMEVQKYHALNIPVAVWGVAVVKETSWTYIYGHTVQEVSVKDVPGGGCYTCTEPIDPFNPGACTLNSNDSPTGAAKDVVLARVPATSSLRDPAQWQYWWNHSATPCAAQDIIEGCGSPNAPCWCKGPPTLPLHLRVVALSAAAYFSVDKITIGTETRYVMVQGNAFEPIAYVRIAGKVSGVPTLTDFPPLSTSTCSSNPCTYGFFIRHSTNPTQSVELSMEAVNDWVAAGNTRPDAFLTPAMEPFANRINHVQGHAHLSRIDGTTGGTNELLIGYFAGHFWPGNIPNTSYPTCNIGSPTTCNGTPGCRWDTEVLGGRCLSDPCTTLVGATNCNNFDQCEFRGGICRARPTLGGARFTKVNLNALKPWCSGGGCL